MTVDLAFSARLCEMITSRICHDMVGPINSLVNGMDLADEDSELALQVQPTIKRSAHVIAAQLRFFRLCFGQGGYTAWNLNELNQIIQAYLQYENIHVLWRTPPSSKILERWGKTLLHMIFHYSQALRRGGEIIIDPAPPKETGPALYMSGTGDRPLIQHVPQAILCAGKLPTSDELNTSVAPAVSTYLLFQKQHIKVHHQPPLTFIFKPR